MSEQVTLEQKADRLYQFIYSELKDKAMAPSHREMCAHLKCSPNTLAELLNHLEQSGKGLHRVRGRRRRLWVPIQDMEVDDR